MKTTTPKTTKRSLFLEAALVFGHTVMTLSLALLDYFGIVSLGRAGFRLKECCATYLKDEVNS